MSNLVLLKWTDSNNKKQRIQIISELSPKWSDISDLLGFSPALTQQIELNYNRVQNRSKEVIHLWLSSKERAYRYSTTWEGLISVLKKWALLSLQHVINLLGLVLMGLLLT